MIKLEDQFGRSKILLRKWENVGGQSYQRKENKFPRTKSAWSCSGCRKIQNKLENFN